MNQFKSQISNRKARPFVIVFSGYGLNCEEETLHAFETAGARGQIVHINDAIEKPEMLDTAQIIAMPGGFSYGDDIGSGKAYGNRLRGHLGAKLQKFFDRDTLTIGICNGFQILTAAGILPGALLANDSGRYSCRWVDLDIAGESPWFSGIQRLSLPIAHGEGKYYAPQETLQQLQSDKAIALRYVKGDISTHLDLPGNPNGSIENIAGVSAKKGRILGLMPHPERGISFFQLPHWTYLKESYIRKGEPLPEEGPGLQLFRNAVHYFA
ncbi:phosphoribosylformylglycinamidine synthase I [Candidatus Parcubacteria bacterium]|nr:MAG: phosphoribosylformylglycinamidine synthase I [Candidatus Parcubacteria bacterium]